MSKKLNLVATSIFVLCSLQFVHAVDFDAVIEKYFEENHQKLELNRSDYQNYVVTDQYTSEHNQVTHIYIKQTYSNIEVFDGVANFNIQDGKVLGFGNRLVSNLHSKISGQIPSLSPIQAVKSAASSLDLDLKEEVRIINAFSGKEFILSGSGISQEQIPVKLVYLSENDNVRLAWDLSIYTLDSKNWYSLQIDAISGKLLNKTDWVLECKFEDKDHIHGHDKMKKASNKPGTNVLSKKAPDSYEVFAIPVESPNHGSRTVVVDPADALASPFGWHDVDGISGAEFTITRGNNVYASQDTAASNSPGYSPDGGSSLDFMFPLNLNQSPYAYRDASITNLFYWNNLMHDIFYHYGFDEVAGNFQDNNYGNGGLGTDFVFADAQDGSGTNNANFATPPDGNNPRMQMFLWDGFGFDIDSDFDNGVIAHEYGHGISNRLTGGPSNTGCLSNAEQMGEGWSDYFGMVLTIDSGDMAEDIRGVGTYASGQTPAGNGIRPAPYTTDMNINGFTYAATNNTASISQPHGVGFVWASMLWDMTWEFIDMYGYDPDVYNGTGGNNMAMQLVMDGLKMQPCNPGFVDGRDAILLADQALYGGIHQCMIWEVFANRGLGAFADQGSSSSRTDQIESFDIPNICITATNAPNADFSINVISACNGIVSFDDASTDIPQFYLWKFGDGDTSTVPNPTHQYNTSGTFYVELTVTNNVGSNSIVFPVIIDFPDEPIAVASDACVGESVQLNAIADNQAWWYDNNGSFIGSGAVLFTQPLNQDVTYEVENVKPFPSQNAGPVDNNFGGGGYHGTNFVGTVDFEAFEPLTIVSAFVDAEFPGERTFVLWDDLSGNGDTLQVVSVIIPTSGPQRVNLGFEVPFPGEYSIGGRGVDLYRNNSGASYPYNTAALNLISIVGSSAGPDFYYYLYDLEVQPAPCRSEKVPVFINLSDPGFSFSQSGNTFNFISNENGASSYFWDFGDGTTSSSKDPVHTFQDDGPFIISLTIDGSCTKTDTISGNVSISGPATPEFNISPNPTSGSIVIESGSATGSDSEVFLYSTEGKELYSVSWPERELFLELNLDQYSQGVYFVRIITPQGNAIERIVIQR